MGSQSCISALMRSARFWSVLHVSWGSGEVGGGLWRPKQGTSRSQGGFCLSLCVHEEAAGKVALQYAQSWGGRQEERHSQDTCLRPLQHSPFPRPLLWQHALKRASSSDGLRNMEKEAVVQGGPRTRALGVSWS